MAKRGRKIGQNVNQRDERGWRVPRAGTIRHRVYEMMLERKTNAQMQRALGISYMSVVMHKQHIAKPDRTNAQRYNREHPDDPAHPHQLLAPEKWNDAVEAAARIADAYANENQAMAADTILLDPLLAGGALTAESASRSKDLMIEGCIHSSMFHAAQNIAAAIRALKRA